jgi:hypothetical protein
MWWWMVSMRKRTAVRAAVVLALVSAALIATLPGHGRARADDRYGCDVVWTGPRSGEWDKAANWSMRRVPAAGDRVCVPRGSTVSILRGDWRAGSVEIGGQLQVTHGNLRLTDARATSELGGLVMAHGEVGVAGVLELADELYWGPGAHLFGPGLIDVGVAATSRMVGGEGATLPKRVTVDAPVDVGQAGSPPPPCGPYSPLASQACGTRDRAALADVRATWAEFTSLLDSRAEPERIAKLLLPGRWDAKGGGTSDLVAVAKQARRLTRTGPLGPLIVVGNRAYAGTPPGGHVEFERAGDGWLVAGL